MPPKRSEPVSGLANPFVKSFTHLRDKVGLYILLRRMRD